MNNLSHIERLLPELRAYAKSICSSDDNVEDLVHDSVERALRSQTRPELIDDMRPWMFRIIRNLHYDELRKRRVRRKYFLAEYCLSNELGDGSDTARDVMVRMAFERLTPDKREVLFLVDIMGLKYLEAAAVMDVPAGTVMSRVSRARASLLDLVDRSNGPVFEVGGRT